MSGRLKVGVLVSGRGSNLAALIEAAARPGFPARIAAVVSNVVGAPALAHAEAAGITNFTLPHGAYADRAAFEYALTAALEACEVDLVCLAGFMRLLTPAFVGHWQDRLINIHPSLLPAFRGLDTHARALAAGVRFTGCTVHFVRAEMDDGPIIVQAAVPVLPEDTPQTLAERVLAAEHRAYPLALSLIAEGRVRVEGTRAVVSGGTWPADMVLAPG